jgi:hypothetical protein
MSGYGCPDWQRVDQKRRAERDTKEKTRPEDKAVLRPGGGEFAFVYTCY